MSKAFAVLKLDHGDALSKVFQTAIAYSFAMISVQRVKLTKAARERMHVLAWIGARPN